MDDSLWIRLSDAVHALRSELLAAVDEARGSAIRFELTSIEMEFLVEVRRERTEEGGISFGVISLGGKSARSSASTHRVKLALTPTGDLGRRPEIADFERDSASK